MLNVRRIGFSLKTVVNDTSVTGRLNNVFTVPSMNITSRRRRNKPPMQQSRGDRSIGKIASSRRKTLHERAAFDSVRSQQDHLQSRHMEAKLRSHGAYGFDMGMDLQDLARFDAAQGNTAFDPISGTVRSNKKSRFRDEIRRRIRSAAIEPDDELMETFAQMEHDMALDAISEMQNPSNGNPSRRGYGSLSTEELLFSSHNPEVERLVEAGYSQDQARKMRMAEKRSSKRNGDTPVSRMVNGVEVFDGEARPRAPEKVRRISDPDSDDDPDMQGFEELFIDDFNPSTRKSRRSKSSWSGLRAGNDKFAAADDVEINPFLQMLIDADESKSKKKSKKKKRSSVTGKRSRDDGRMFGEWAGNDLNMESAYDRAMSRDEMKGLFGAIFDEHGGAGLHPDMDLDSDFDSDFDNSEIERELLRNMSPEERVAYYDHVRELMGEFRDPSLAETMNADMGYDFMSDADDEREGVQRGDIHPEGVIIDADFVEVDGGSGTSRHNRRFSTYIGGSTHITRAVRSHTSYAGLSAGLGPLSAKSLVYSTDVRYFASKKKAVVVAKGKTLTKLKSEAEVSKSNPKAAPVSVVMPDTEMPIIDDELTAAMQALDSLSKDQRYCDLKGIKSRNSKVSNAELDLSQVYDDGSGELPPGYYDEAVDDEDDVPLRKPRHKAAAAADTEAGAGVDADVGADVGAGAGVGAEEEAIRRLDDELGDDMFESDFDSDFDIEGLDDEYDSNGERFQEADTLTHEYEYDESEEAYQLLQAERAHVRRMRGELLSAEDLDLEDAADAAMTDNSPKYGHKKRGRERSRLRSRGHASRVDPQFALQERHRLDEEWQRDMMGMVSEGEGLDYGDENKDWISDKETRVVGQIVGGEKIEAFEFHEKDLDERFTYGGGPGGQATNKTRNCVMLQHVPTGTIVKCHQTRSLFENRMIARKIMKRKLEAIALGRDSYFGRKMARLRRRKDRRRRRYNNKAAEAAVAAE